MIKKKLMKTLCATVLSAAMLIMGPCVEANAVTTSAGSIAKGIDVSKHNGVIDWAQVKASGVSFAFIKIGSTYSGIDPMFHYNITNAQANGIKTGVYIYSYASNVEEAAIEAQLVLSWLAPYSLQLPVVYDVEDKKQSALPNDQLGAMINTFCSAIDAAGYYPMVYSYKNFYNGKIGATPWDKWAAQYSSQLDLASSVSFWQYTSSGSVPGIGGRVDMNYQYKDFSNLIIPEGFLPHGNTIRFYSNWKMQTGWVNYQGLKYYMDPAGNMVTGMFTDADGKNYYLTPGSGAASIGATNVNGLILYFGEDGAQQSGFINYGQGLKYFDPLLSGAMQLANFFSVDNGLYYAGADGTLATGLTTIGGAKYYFNAASIMETGLQNIGGLQYYFGPDGIMQTGLVDYGQGLRYFDPALDGAMSLLSWVVINNQKYYTGADGAFLKGMQNIGGVNYYFNEAGVLTPGLAAVNGAMYFFGADGAQTFGLVDFGQGPRYFDPAMGGAMAVNRAVLIDGVAYLAGADGSLVPIPTEPVAADPQAAALAGTAAAPTAQVSSAQAVPAA